VWSWEIPVYFFIGGTAGMAAVIALPALVFHDVDLVLTAMCLAAAGAIVSPILLVMDLGRPRLFINILRAFKHKSPTSMGAWILVVSGVWAIPGLAALKLHARHMFGGGIDGMLRILAGLLILGSAFWGMLLATYTGVLLGATAIPAWFFASGAFADSLRSGRSGFRRGVT
jgi:formate-dependent nitrite reductase membrane component NrfD